MKAIAQQINYNEQGFEQTAKAPNFDRIARAYRWMEWLSFGPWLWKCRAAFLAQICNAQPQRALVIGDGDGRFTARLLAESCCTSVDAIDLSQAMLAEMRCNAGGNASRIRMQCADARTWECDAPGYDLIVTHFLLDCLTQGEVNELAIRLRRYVSPEALWVISEFAIPQSRFGMLVARPLIISLYKAFRVLTGLEVCRLPDHKRALDEAGFMRVCERQALGGLLISELWKPAPAS